MSVDKYNEYDDKSCHVDKVVPDDDTIRFDINGEIDLANLPSVSNWMDHAIDHQHARVCLGLHELHYLDSAGISWLFHLARRLSSRSQTLSCELPVGHPLGSVFHYVKLDRVIDIQRDEPTDTSL